GTIFASLATPIPISISPLATPIPISISPLATASAPPVPHGHRLVFAFISAESPKRCIMSGKQRSVVNAPKHGADRKLWNFTCTELKTISRGRAHARGLLSCYRFLGGVRHHRRGLLFQRTTTALPWMLFSAPS